MFQGDGKCQEERLGGGKKSDSCEEMSRQRTWSAVKMEEDGGR